MTEWHRAVVEREDEVIVVEAGTRVECTLALEDWVAENWQPGDDAYVCKVNYYIDRNGAHGQSGKRTVAEVVSQPNPTPNLGKRSRSRRRQDA